MKREKFVPVDLVRIVSGKRTDGEEIDVDFILTIRQRPGLSNIPLTPE